MALLDAPAELIGDVRGPTGATDNALARFDGTSGKLLQNSGVILDDSDAMTGVTALQIDGTGTGDLLEVLRDGGTNGFFLVSFDGNGPDLSGGPTYMGFSIGASEAMRIDASGNLVMNQHDIKEVDQIDGGALVSDILHIAAHTAAMVDPDADGKVTFHNFLTFNGITDFTGTTDANFQVVSWDATVDCSGQSIVIPQGFWWTPTIQYDTPQSFGGAAVFQDASVWEETSALGAAHGVFSIGSFLGSIKYDLGHAGTGTPPSMVYGYDAGPRIDASSGTLTVPEMVGYATNRPFALKTALGLQQLRAGAVCTLYTHLQVNSGNANALILEGGSTITTEVGLDIIDLNQGATAISIRSNDPNAYMTHMGPVGIGTATIPHAGVGAAKLAIEGTNASTAGPHVQFTTASDDYPLMQILPWSHDNTNIYWDAAYNGTNVLSSDTGSNFQIGKSSDLLKFSADSAVAVGSPVSFVVAFQIEPDAEVMFSPSGALKTYWRDANIWAYSPSDSIFELSADGYVRVGAGTTSHSLGAHGDFLVSGKLEVNGEAWFDTTLNVANIDVTSGFEISLYDGADVSALIYWNRAVTWGLDASDHVWLVTSYANRLNNHDHGAETNPTLYVHSATDPNTDNTQWWSITHDQTNAVYTVGGSGKHRFDHQMEIVYAVRPHLYITTSFADTDRYQSIAFAQRDYSTEPEGTCGIFSYVDASSNFLGIGGGDGYLNAATSVTLYTASGVTTRSGTAVLTATSSQTIGIGTTTAPHGGVGMAKLAIEGANASTAGPHIQFTTASDDYPIMQFLNWSHDNIRLYFDAYYDGANKSSDAGSNFVIWKLSDALAFRYSSGNAQGAAVGWTTSFSIEADGEILFSPSQALKHYYRDIGIYIYSANDGYLDLVADGAVRCNENLWIGTQDQTLGTLSVFGSGTGAATGGRIYLYTAADHDASINAYLIRAQSDDLELCSVTTPKLTYEGGDDIWSFKTDVEIPSTDAYYFGDAATNGSWRIIRSGDDLVIERREAGAYVTKSTISA